MGGGQLQRPKPAATTASRLHDSGQSRIQETENPPGGVTEPLRIRPERAEGRTSGPGRRVVGGNQEPVAKPESEPVAVDAEGTTATKPSEDSIAAPAQDEGQAEPVDVAGGLAMHGVLLEARDQLGEDPTGQAAIAKAQQALLNFSQALQDLESTPLWDTLTRRGEQLDADQVMGPQLRAWMTALRIGPDQERPVAAQESHATQVLQEVRGELQQLREELQEFASGQIPEDPQERSRLARALKACLDKAREVLLSIMVMATVAVYRIDDAAQSLVTQIGHGAVQGAQAVASAAQEAGRVAGGALESAGPALPWGLTVAMVGLQAVSARTMLAQNLSTVPPPGQPNPLSVTHDSSARSAVEEIGTGQPGAVAADADGLNKDDGPGPLDDREVEMPAEDAAWKRSEQKPHKRR